MKSSRARNKIKHWLNIHQRERAIEIGRKLIEKEARKYRVALKEIKDEELPKIASEYGLGPRRRSDGRHWLRQIFGAAGAGTARARRHAAPPEGEGSGGIGSAVRRVFGGD